MDKLLITGATGFIGQALIGHLEDKDYNLTAVVRCRVDVLPNTVKQVPVGDFHPGTDWSKALLDVDTIIHLAARVHVMKESCANPLEAFRLTNTSSTLNLAKQAASAGVRRFLFLSSIKVNGEFTLNDKAFKPDDLNIPSDYYGLSKYEAEKGLMEIADQTGLEVVVIRPTLVYGAGVKGNFRQMMFWVSKGMPLPLGAINGLRSFVALDNLLDLITVCIKHSAAAGQTFLISDDEDLTTTELLTRIGGVLGKPVRLFAIPESILSKVLTLIGKEAVAQRLCTSLQVDIKKTKSLLGWQPIINVDQALEKTARAWQNQKN